MTANIDAVDDLVLPGKQKRDAAYLRERIRKASPAIYERLERGELPSVNEAARLAGVIKPDTPLKQLRRAWKKVDRKDRERFLHEQLDAGDPAPKASISLRLPACRPEHLIGPDGKLTAIAIYHLWDAMISRSMTPADLMQEIGRNRFDYTLQEALNRSRKPRSELVEDLVEWLMKK